MKACDRRSFLRNAAASAAALALARRLPAQPSSDKPLRALVRPGIRVGAQATFNDLQDARLAEFLALNFNTLTAGHELKWGALRPSPTTFDFSRADRMVAFAEQHQMHFHGHNLCWNHWNPGWLQTTLTRANAEKYLVDHIATVAGRYKGCVDSWDVVNEPLGTWYSPATGQPPRPWLDLIGPRYLDVAFHAAAVADPAALRVLNFDRLEQPITASEETRAQALAMIAGLVQRGAPIQAVGFESHLFAWDAMENPSQDRLVRSIRDLGLKVLITELDITDTKIAGPVEHVDRAVADAYANYLLQMVPRMEAEQVIFWTPTDVQSELDQYHGSNFDRPDHMRHRPGLVDNFLQPKPAYYAVARALAKLFA
jgi:endo-1,4-beta-xylanase